MHFSAKRGIVIACRLSVSLSVRLSVTLVNCDHTRWNSSEVISPSVSLGRSLFATPTWRVCSKENTPKFGPKVTHGSPPPLIWASETFDRKLRPNGYRWRNGHNGEPIGNHHRSIALSNGAIADRLRPHVPPKLGSICPQDTQMAVYLRNGWSDTLRVWFDLGYRVFRIGGSNGAISGYIRSKLAAGCHLG